MVFVPPHHVKVQGCCCHVAGAGDSPARQSLFLSAERAHPVLAGGRGGHKPFSPSSAQGC